MMLYSFLSVVLTCCVLCLQRSLVHGASRDEIMDSVYNHLSQLKTTVDENTDYLRVWSSRYDFIKRLNNDFEEMSRIIKDMIADLSLENSMSESPVNPNEIEKKIAESGGKLTSTTSSRKSIEDVLQAGRSASFLKLEEQLLELQSLQSNLTLKMRTFEAKILALNAIHGKINCVENHTLEISGLKLKLESIENRCDYPPKIKNGYFVNMSRSHGAVLTYDCQENMTLVDKGKVECHFGEWIGTPPVCIEKGCYDPPRINNGDVLKWSSNHGSEVTYRCRGGRVLVSKGSVECHFGEWIGTRPVCMENCNENDLNAYLGLEFTAHVIHQHSEILNVSCRKRYHTPYPGMIIKCDNGVWQVPDKPCIKGHFDTTFVLRFRPPMHIECYSYENYKKVKFSRVLDIGNGAELSRESKIVIERNPAILSLENVGLTDMMGAYQCEIEEENKSFKIVTLNHMGKLFGDFIPLEAFQVANIGDMIEFEVEHGNFRHRLPIKWTHNGKQIPSWNNRLKAVIPSVQLEDAGIYECFYEERRDQNRHAFMKLTVRKCGANLYGKNCNKICPTCYNGGICHDDFGTCICPAGFTGFNCEIACDDGYFGTRCSETCERGYYFCQKQLFCKPDPFGCACPPGYRGVNCEDGCDAGWYGADCKQRCHCAKGSDSCNRSTGACAGGCSEGWEGDSCQIEWKNNTGADF